MDQPRVISEESLSLLMTRPIKVNEPPSSPISPVVFTTGTTDDEGGPTPFVEGGLEGGLEGGA